MKTDPVPASFAAAHRLMRQGIAEKVFPGAVLRVARGLDVLFERAYGVTDCTTGVPVTPQTCFDLASLTKVLATTPALIKLVQAGALSLDQPLASILPPFDQPSKAAITLEQLLRHRSGLPAYRPYFQGLKGDNPAARKKDLNRRLTTEPLAGPVGRQTVYSDIGFMILRWVVETRTGLRLDRYVDEAVFEPLGIRRLFYVDVEAHVPLENPAATEKCPWRHTVIRGVVHDENAYAVGGVEGHAGLFGDAAGVHRLLAALLAAYKKEQADVFNPQTVGRFLRVPPGAGRALGFDTPSTEASSSGRFFSSRTVGHLGFTGTSVWMDLARGVIVVLLTNRIHFGRDNDAIRHFRPVLHDSIMQRFCA